MANLPNSSSAFHFDFYDPLPDIKIDHVEKVKKAQRQYEIDLDEAERDYKNTYNMMVTEWERTRPLREQEDLIEQEMK